MSSRKRVYNTSKIRENYSYTTEEVAELYDVTQATVRRWLSKEGLDRIPKTRPHLVHSSHLLKFLEQKNSAHKHPCGQNQVFCIKCRLPVEPRMASARIKQLPNKTLHYLATCKVCNKGINTFIGVAQWSKNHPLAVYLEDAVGNPNESHQTPRECKPEESAQLCLKLII